MRNPKRQFKDEEILSCTSWENFPRKRSVKHAHSTRLRDYYIAHVESANALARTKAQDQKSMRDLVYSVLRRESGLFTSSETWAEPMAI